MWCILPVVCCLLWQLFSHDIYSWLKPRMSKPPTVSGVKVSCLGCLTVNSSHMCSLQSTHLSNTLEPMCVEIAVSMFFHHRLLEAVKWPHDITFTFILTEILLSLSFLLRYYFHFHSYRDITFTFILTEILLSLSFLPRYLFEDFILKSLNGSCCCD